MKIEIAELREFQFVLRWDEPIKLLTIALELTNKDVDNPLDIRIVPLSENYAKRIMGQEEPLTHYVTVRRTSGYREQILEALNTAIETPTALILSMNLR